MTQIHPTAIVDPKAQIGNGVSIGPLSVVGPNVTLEDNVKLHSHVVVEGHTTIGKDCKVFPFASIGHVPQDLKFGGEESRLEIGPNNTIRENVTMNPGTEGGGMVTRVGANGLYMAGAHIAHDCVVGNDVIFANNAGVAGHCVIGDFVILGGFSAVHQFVRIGEHAFIGGMSGIENDVIPFGMAMGNRAALSGLNTIGLKRRGVPREQIHNLRKAYRLLFATEGTLSERLEDVDKMFGEDVGVRQVLDFIRAPSDRSLCIPKTNS